MPLEIHRWSEPTVAANLAVDEALAREAGAAGRRVLRFWWGGPPAVVLGRSERPEQVAYLDACERLGVPVLQRVTGGGSVLQTETVFNYSLTAPDPGNLDIHRRFAQGAALLVETLRLLGVEAQPRGISDVAVGERKISGNAQARKWHAILLHGTLLVDLDRELLEAVLRHPPREPEYRRGRPHGEFIITLRDLGVPALRQDVEIACERAAHRIRLDESF